MVKKKKREDTEVEERRTDRSVDRQRGIGALWEARFRENQTLRCVRR